MTLGEQIKEAREKKNYSQEELAEICGVSRQAVSKWENDISIPQGANRETLNEVLGVECPQEENSAFTKMNEESFALKRRFLMLSGWVTAAVLLVSIICIGFYVITKPKQQDSGQMPGGDISQAGTEHRQGQNTGQTPDADPSGSGRKEETDTQPRVTSVCFYDSEQNEVPDEALWYNAAYIESILIQWEGPTAPGSISIHYIPGGSNMIEHAEILSTKEILDFGTAALLNPKALKDEKISGHVTFTLNYGDITVNSDQYNIFYDPSLPPANEETASSRDR